MYNNPHNSFLWWIGIHRKILCPPDTTNRFFSKIGKFAKSCLNVYILHWVPKTELKMFLPNILNIPEWNTILRL